MVQGLAELNRRWGAIPGQVRAAAREALEEVAQAIVMDMRRAAPKRTHTLEKSINWTWGDAPEGAMVVGVVGDTDYGTMRITIYAGDATTQVRQARSSGSRSRDRYRSGSFDANYARYIEFGTSKMRARPFFYPVWRVRRRSAKAKITRAINKAIRG